MTATASYYTGDGLGFQHLGQDSPTPPDALTPSPGQAMQQTVRDPWTWGRLGVIGGTISMPLLAYHGYKRNDSVGWAIAWGLLGSWFWPIALPVAFAQGFAKPGRPVRRNARRRSARRRRSSRRRTSRRAR